MFKKRGVYHWKELGQSALLFVLLSYFFGAISLIFIGLGYVALGLLVYPFQQLNYWIWTQINTVTKTIGEFILLAVLYFLVVVPVGLFFQLFRAKKKGITSTLELAETTNSAEDLEKTW